VSPRAIRRRGGGDLAPDLKEQLVYRQASYLTGAMLAIDGGALPTI